MTAPSPDDLWALELAKARQAAGPGARGGDGFWLAALAGLAVWLRTLLTTPAGEAVPARAEVLAALHGEISNRTRHVIAALAAEAPETPILLLGRPQEPLPALRRRLAEQGLPNARLIRPWSLFDGLAAFPAIVRRLIDGARALGAAEWRPARRELAAICFRMALGETSARWARRLAGVRQVVIGHTGVADSHRLERALQAQGARTVHWVHGVSQGLNFVAGSDVGLFQCRSDAEWHAALGGYGRALALVGPAPALAPAGEGWLLLSNLVHPMNPQFRESGIAGETELLEATARAARARGVERLAWKPHPVLDTLEPGVREAITARAAALGFRRYTDSGLAGARDFSAILSTPSTAALDVLRLGRLPVIVGGEAPDPMSAIARLPLRSDLAGIGAAVDRLADEPALFQAAWTAVGPGRPPGLSDLLALL